MHVLAQRYSDRTGGYVRILKNGYRSSGSDRSLMAIVELVGNARDIVYHSSQRTSANVKSQLREVEKLKCI
jgi:Ribosomal protein L17